MTRPQKCSFPWVGCFSKFPLPLLLQAVGYEFHEQVKGLLFTCWDSRGLEAKTEYVICFDCQIIPSMSTDLQKINYYVISQSGSYTEERSLATLLEKIEL